jgi:hypothetical protein
MKKAKDLEVLVEVRVKTPIELVTESYEAAKRAGQRNTVLVLEQLLADLKATA